MRTNMLHSLHACYLAGESPGTILSAATVLKDPAYRVTEDVTKLTSEMAGLFQSVCQPALEITVVTRVLAQMMGGGQLLQVVVNHLHSSATLPLSESH
jgi:ABC-type uncharacterized transport system fused permease/ATPase subunit